MRHLAAMVVTADGMPPDPLPSLEQVDEHTWRLRPTGPPGDYQVDLFGQGPQGDVSVSFAMVTSG